jgi:hypothetical protein
MHRRRNSSCDCRHTRSRCDGQSFGLATRNMTFFPIIVGGSPRPPDYRTIPAEALAKIRRRSKALGAGAVTVGLASVIVLIILSVNAARGTTPFFDFVLILVGGASLGLLWSGFAVLRMRSVVHTGQLEANAAIAIRRIVLAMWFYSLVMAVLGCLLAALVGSGPRVNQGALLSVVFSAFVVAAYAGMDSILVRRLLPSPAQLRR